MSVLGGPLGAVLGWGRTAEPRHGVLQPAYNLLWWDHYHGRPGHPAVVQLLSRCGQAVESLGLVLRADAPPTACQPLLQLSALTDLQLHGMAALGATTVGIVAQLTGLKQLYLTDLAALKDPMLLPLTALTALEEVTLHTWVVYRTIDPEVYKCKSQVCVTGV